MQLQRNTANGSAVTANWKFWKLLMRKTPDGASEIVEENIREKEGERILKLIKEDAYVITLEISGKMLTSEELADRIETLGIQGKSHLVFVIGGSIGLGREVLRRSDYALLLFPK